MRYNELLLCKPQGLLYCDCLNLSSCAMELPESRVNVDSLVPTAKKARRESKFQQEWKDYGMVGSTRGPTFARCKLCNTDISVAHGGVNDVKKHLATSKHQEMANSVSSSESLRAYFRPSL